MGHGAMLRNTATLANAITSQVAPPILPMLGHSMKGDTNGDAKARMVASGHLDCVHCAGQLNNLSALRVISKLFIPGRISPLQKALVVKENDQKAILSRAIGDGANDVSMIQAAHIGVSISRVEIYKQVSHYLNIHMTFFIKGLQAVRSADVAISQFRFFNSQKPFKRTRKKLLVYGA